MSIELKRLRAEQARVIAARMEMEVKLEELLEAHDRVAREIDNQKAKEAELADRIAKSGGQ